MGEGFTTDPTLLLGRDHAQWGEYVIVESGAGRTVNVLSVGADPDSPSITSKGDPSVPNEDALLSMDEGPLTLLAVADAHFGAEASHELLGALARASNSIPSSFEALEELVGGLGGTDTGGDSASTLLVAVLDRTVQSGFGLSFGDSSLFRVGSEGAQVVNVRRAQFLNPHGPEQIRPEEGHGFRFSAEPGQLVMACTDGVTECHYRSASTSITAEHLGRIFSETRDDPSQYARRLAGMALAGVDGHPGGQDNFALVVTATSTESGR